MENAIQELPITIAANGVVTFANDAVRTSKATCCGWLEHEQGSGQFTLLKPGIYEILFNGDISSATTGDIALVFKINGESLTGTQMDYTVATANLYRNVSANRLIRVCGNTSKTITVSNISAQAILVKNASFILKKLA